MKYFEQRALNKKLSNIVENNGLGINAIDCIKKGADMSKVDCNQTVFYDGATMPLLSALVNNGLLYMVEEAVDNGADVNIVDEEGFTPLMYAVLPTTGDRNLSIVRYLVEQGADVCARRDYQGAHESVLTRAAQFADTDLVEYLLACGAGKSVTEEDLNLFNARLASMEALRATKDDSQTNFKEIKARYIGVLDMLKDAYAQNQQEVQM